MKRASFFFLSFFLLFIFFAPRSSSCAPLWPSYLSSNPPLFSSLSPLVFPEPQVDDSIETTVTIGEMRKSLVYYEGFNNLTRLVNETLVPAGNKIVDKYNQLVTETRVFIILFGLATTGLIASVIF